MLGCLVYGLDSTAGWVGVAQAGKLGQVRSVVLLMLPGGRKGEGRGGGGCSGSRSGAWTLGMVGVKV